MNVLANFVDVSEDILLLKGFCKESLKGKLKWLFFLYPLCLLAVTLLKLTSLVYSIKHNKYSKKR
ncbi:hypothetical protein B4127_1575 [Bacillus pumilus]|uniref:Uncharacterized protein n=1 Tax=Bacillus pumilus TaxID=1408 RepID=A0AB34QQ45_BACPU|nr:hypothetical protein B4127_1575 [Bacillus pumilus]